MDGAACCGHVIPAFRIASPTADLTRKRRCHGADTFLAMHWGHWVVTRQGPAVSEARTRVVLAKYLVAVPFAAHAAIAMPLPT
jgi:hypothetical protein